MLIHAPMLKVGLMSIISSALPLLTLAVCVWRANTYVHS